MPDSRDLTPPQVRDLVREMVVRVLREQSNAEPKSEGALTDAVGGVRTALFVFSGREFPDPSFWDAAAAIAAQGFAAEALFSFTFKRFFSPELALARMPAGCAHLDASCEKRLSPHVGGASVVVAPPLSLNTMAKLAAGMDDSVPLFALASALQRGVPVFVAADTDTVEAGFAARWPNAPPGVVRLAVDNLHRVRALGVRFVACDRLAGEVAAAFRVEPNETPERLARVRPPVKRQFVTAEDVWKARAAGLKQLRVSPPDVVTDQAREHAEREGIEFVSE